jgi:hypothetical protein
MGNQATWPLVVGAKHGITIQMRHKHLFTKQEKRIFIVFIIGIVFELFANLLVTSENAKLINNNSGRGDRHLTQTRVNVPVTTTL